MSQLNAKLKAIKMRNDAAKDLMLTGTDDVTTLLRMVATLRNQRNYFMWCLFAEFGDLHVLSFNKRKQDAKLVEVMK